MAVLVIFALIEPFAKRIMKKKIDWNLVINGLTLLGVIMGGLVSFFFIDKAAVKLTNIQTRVAEIEASHRDVILQLDLKNKRIDSASDFVELVARLRPAISIDNNLGHQVEFLKGEVAIKVKLKNLGRYPVLISQPKIVIASERDSVIATDRNTEGILQEGKDYQVILTPSPYTMSQDEELIIGWVIKVDARFDGIYYRLEWKNSIEQVITEGAMKVLEEHYSKEEISKITNTLIGTRGGFRNKSE